MATVQEIKNAAQEFEPMKSRFGCFLLRPPVELIDTATNETVHADCIDENGKYPNHVHIKERGFWWPVQSFKLVN